MEKTIMDDLNASLLGMTKQISKIADLLSQNPQNFNAGIWELVKSIFNVLTPVGMSLAAMFFVIDFLQKSMNFEFVKWEAVVKAIIKLTIIKAVLENSLYILQVIFGIVGEIINSVSSPDIAKINITGANLQSISKSVHGMDLIDQIGFYWSISPWLFILKLVGIVILLIVYGRFIEIYIYTMIAPIALSTLMSDSFNVGKRFIQNYIAVCFQGVIILIGISIYAKMLSNNLLGVTSKDPSSWEIISSMSITSLILLLIVVKSGSWAKQVLGAG